MRQRRHAAKTSEAQAVPVVPRSRSRKELRAPRVRLTHFEVRRGDRIRLRIAVADDALADVGDELGALIKRIAPSTQTSIVPATVVEAIEATETVTTADVIIPREHSEHDTAYHVQLRDHLEALFSSLCDTALSDALDVARKERDRRAEGGN